MELEERYFSLIMRTKDGGGRGCSTFKRNSELEESVMLRGGEAANLSGAVLSCGEEEFVHFQPVTLHKK